MSTVLKPLILQRADPFILKHTDGFYYFTASVPEYDRIEIRRSRTLAGLADAKPLVVWRKPSTGPYSELIWAPEIHFNQGRWYIYFAAAPNREIKDDLFQHRMYVITPPGDGAMVEGWKMIGPIQTGIDTFCLDATTFTHRGKLYYLWAQKTPNVAGNSNLHIAEMKTPWELASAPVMISKPEFPWETRGFSVNEGPAVLIRHGTVFVSYSASATDENYCVGLLQADENANLLDASSWKKSSEPVSRSCYEHGVYGPGHNSFTVSEDGKRDILVYHARTYTNIVGDPLWDPNRHTYIKTLGWDNTGKPLFGRPSIDEYS
jgi:GH43 family beta-xylosidase